jgi:hypothetical protein
MGNRQAAFIAALLVTISPYHVWYSRQTRCYPLLSLLGTLSFLGFFRFCFGKKNKWSDLLYVVATGLAFLTHYTFAVGIIFQNLFVFLVKRRCLREWLMMQVAAGAICAVSIPFFLPALSAAQKMGSCFDAITLKDIAHNILAWGSGNVIVGVAIALAASLAVLREAVFVLAPTGIWRRFARRAGEQRTINPETLSGGPGQDTMRRTAIEYLMFMGFIFVGPFLFSWLISVIVQPFFLYRQVISYQPVFLGFIALGISRFKRVSVRTAFVALLAAGAVAGLVRSVYGEGAWRLPTEEVVRHVEDHWQDGDTILSIDNNFNGLFFYHCGKLPHFMFTPATHWGKLFQLLCPKKQTVYCVEPLLWTQIRRVKRIWVIVESRDRSYFEDLRTRFSFEILEEREFGVNFRMLLWQTTEWRYDK